MTPELKVILRQEASRAAFEQAVGLLIVGAFEGIFGQAILAGMPVFFHNHLAVWLVVSLALLMMVDACLFYQLRLLVREPWNTHRWGWRLILSLFAVLCTMAVAALSVSLVEALLGKTLPTGSRASWAAPALFLLLFASIAGALLIDFWRRTRIFRDLSDMKMLLENIEECYSQHLKHPLLAKNRLFCLKVSAQPDVLQWNQPTDSVLSTDKMIWQAYNKNLWPMLILAGRGGGASTQMYLLADTLAAETRANLNALLDNAPEWLSQPEKARLMESQLRFPVLLDLSTWNAEAYAQSKTSFEHWMIEEIARTYHIKRRAATTWLRVGRFVPLLDAYHALGVDQRADINVNLARHPGTPLVICCRSSAYQAIRLERLHPGITLTLAAPDVSDILVSKAQRNASVSAFNAQVNAHPGLKAALQSTLLLNMALSVVVYEPLAQPASTNASRQEWEHTILEQYVKRTLVHGRSTEQVEAAVNGLAWLGRQLKLRALLTFRISDIQPTWLPTPEVQRLYATRMNTVGRWVRIIAGSLFTIAAVQFVAFAYGLNNGIAAATLFPGGSNIPIGLSGQFLIGVLSAWGLMIGMAGALHPVRNFFLIREDVITPLGLRTWVAVVVGVGVAVSFVAVLGGGYVLGFGVVACVGLVCGLALEITLYLNRAFHNTRKGFRHPNQPFEDSKNRALRTAFAYIIIGFLSGGIVFGLSAAWILLEFSDINNGVSYVAEAASTGTLIGVALIALLFGQVATLKRGGAAATKHSALRKTLVSSGVLPMDVLEFANEMRNVGLFCQDGDGFTFPARSEMFRDYFADTYAQAAVALPGPTGQQAGAPPSA